MTKKDDTGKAITPQRTVRRKVEWTEERVALLGTMIDREVAARLELSVQAVTNQRRRRGIAPFRARRANIEWTEEMIALLGTETDRHVATTLGFSVSSVTSKRQKLGIEPANPRSFEPYGYRWTPEGTRLLGTMSDSDVATVLGVSPAVVGAKRRKLGIAPFHAPAPPIEWTEELVAALGTVPDREIADRYGISRVSVYKKRLELGISAHVERRHVVRDDTLAAFLESEGRNTVAARRSGLSEDTIRKLRDELDLPADTWLWNPEEDELLGTASDQEIAGRLGRTLGAVRTRRRKQGIPAFDPRRWRAWEIDLLGAAPDREVAQRIGRSVKAVQLKRWKLGIDAFDRQS